MQQNKGARQLVIVGAGGHGRELFALASSNGALPPETRLLGFVDDGLVASELVDRLQTQWLGPVDRLRDLDAEFVLGVGSSKARRGLGARLSELGAQCAGPIVHPSSWVGPDVLMEEGAVIFAGVTMTTNVRIGRHTHINRGATVGHDCVIGEYVTLAPMAVLSGNVSIGAAAELGSGAVVLPGIRIGESSVVGAGAVVTRDVSDGVTVMGVPAREVFHRSAEEQSR
jgi:sugar O-acyltransferase (sialic acid O-acetyltransferase NeuD family)